MRSINEFFEYRRGVISEERSNDLIMCLLLGRRCLHIVGFPPREEMCEDILHILHLRARHDASEVVKRGHPKRDAVAFRLSREHLLMFLLIVQRVPQYHDQRLQA